MKDSQNTSVLKNTVDTVNSELKVSKDGYSFFMDADTWMLNKDVSILFSKDLLILNPKVLKGFRKTLAMYAEELSAKHTANMYNRFLRMVRDIQCTELDEYTVINWLSMLDDEHQWYLGALRGFFISWHDNHHYGIDSRLVKVLQSFKLRGNQKGISVANRCPYTGAYTDNELLSINLELNRLYSEDIIDLSCYAYVSCIQATARRPANVWQLKAQDLIKNDNDYFLRIPRAKQRNSGFRGSFKELAITEELYLILLNLAADQTSALEQLFGMKLSIKDAFLVPIFVDWKAASVLNSNGDALSSELLASDILHMGTQALNRLYMSNFRRNNKAISERTGDYIHITARRFRYTRGSNLARRGLGPQIIAEALDHSDTQNVMVYTENTADTVTYIDKVIGKQLAPLAQAFKGKVINTLEEVTSDDNLNALVPNSSNEVTGACGTNVFCVKGYEACYLCENW